MNADEVPQDCSVTYGGHRKLLYARSKDGEYTAVQSSGWHAEEQATCDAVREYERLAQQALRAARANQVSPLYFHMYRCRMDPALLAQVAGVWRWRVVRHMRPDVFRKLSRKTLQRYAGALDFTVEELMRLPDELS